MPRRAASQPYLPTTLLPTAHSERSRPAPSSAPSLLRRRRLAESRNLSALVTCDAQSRLHQRPSLVQQIFPPHHLKPLQICHPARNNLFHGDTFLQLTNGLRIS